MRAILPNSHLILASTSETRRKMLKDAAVAFDSVAAPIDEENIRLAAQAEKISPGDLAVLLAEMKIEAAHRRHDFDENTYIMGCDQILDCDGVVYGKPTDFTQAKTQLAALQGKSHKLHTAVMLFKNGQRIWHHLACPQLTMRKMDEVEIDAYLKMIGEAALWSPGSYQIESIGAHLFTDITGDNYAILGLPLLPLLAFLRTHGLAFDEEAG